MPGTFTHAVASFDPTCSAVLLWTRLAEGVRTAELRRGARSRRSATSCTAAATMPIPIGTRRSPSTSRDSSPPPATGTASPRGVSGARSAAPAPCPTGRSSGSAWARRAVPGTRSPRSGCTERWPSARSTSCSTSATTSTRPATRAPRPHDPPHDAVSRDDYRRRLAQIRSDPDLQALHLRHPVTAIWDDHDLADNAWRTGAKPHDPDEQGPWDERARNAAHARAGVAAHAPRRPRGPVRPVAHVHDRRPGRAGAARHAVPRARSAGGRRGHAGPPRPGALAPR